MTNLATRLQGIATDHGRSVGTLAAFISTVRKTMEDSENSLDRAFDRIKWTTRVREATVKLREDSTSLDRAVETLRAADESRQRDQDLYPSGYRNLLNEMAFIYRIALFDAVIPDILKATLVSNLDMLKSGKQMSHREIIESGNGDSLVAAMAERELADFGILGIRKQVRWIKERLNIEIVDSTGELDLVETMARRNLLVHANGFVNNFYLREVPETRLRRGDRVHIDSEYFVSSNQMVTTATNSLLRQISEKFCPGIELPQIGS